MTSTDKKADIADKKADIVVKENIFSRWKSSNKKSDITDKKADIADITDVNEKMKSKTMGEFLQQKERKTETMDEFVHKEKRTSNHTETKGEILQDENENTNKKLLCLDKTGVSTAQQGTHINQNTDNKTKKIDKKEDIDKSKGDLRLTFYLRIRYVNMYVHAKSQFSCYDNPHNVLF